MIITGATGYIGGRLLRSALAQGWIACAVVQAGDPAPLHGGAIRIEDPGRAADLADELMGFRPDMVMHLAAAQTLSDDPTVSDLLVEANLAFGARVLAASRAAGARGLVAAGTYSAHAGGTGDYFPQTLYAATKHAFLDLSEHYRRNTTLQTVMLELSDTYGPGDARPKFLNLVAAAAQSGEPLGASPGDQVVRPLHVDDIIDAFLHTAMLLLDGADLDSVYSVAGPESVTLRQLVEKFELATNSSVPIRWGMRPHRPREIMQPWCGRPLPAWSPRIGLIDGLRDVYGHPAIEGGTEA
jgi:nucleoside-diphosphate-sugar epimerase